MSATREMVADKKAITPLWIVALFVSLTETVLGVAVTQTSGGIQVSLTVFVIVFPLLIAASFFGILWSKPYVFYPPTEFGPQVSVLDYVDAMQRRPALLRQYIDGEVHKPPTEKEVEAADQIVNSFLSRLATNGLLYLYAFSLAHSKKKLIEFVDLNTTLGFPPDDKYGMGILSAMAATGLLTYTKSTEVFGKDGELVKKNVGAITDMNKKLKAQLSKGLSQIIQARVRNEGWNDERKAMIDRKIALIDRYCTDNFSEVK